MRELAKITILSCKCSLLHGQQLAFDAGKEQFQGKLASDVSTLTNHVLQAAEGRQLLQLSHWGSWHWPRYLLKKGRFLEALSGDQGRGESDSEDWVTESLAWADHKTESKKKVSSKKAGVETLLEISATPSWAWKRKSPSNRQNRRKRRPGAKVKREESWNSELLGSTERCGVESQSTNSSPFLPLFYSVVLGTSSSSHCVYRNFLLLSQKAFPTVSFSRASCCCFVRQEKTRPNGRKPQISLGD